MLLGFPTKERIGERSEGLVRFFGKKLFSKDIALKSLIYQNEKPVCPNVRKRIIVLVSIKEESESGMNNKSKESSSILTSSTKIKEERRKKG